MAFMKTLTRWLPKLKRNEDGQVMVITALSIIPILTIAGLAIDFQLTTTTKARIQHSLDAALIAGSRAKQAGKSNAEIQTIVGNYMNAMLASSQNDQNTSCDPIQIVFVEGKEDINGSIHCTQSTTISSAIGRDSLTFSVSSASTYGIGKLDVAFVFDVSGSMGGSKMESLKDAAQEAVDTLIPEDADPGDTDVRISMVSYDDMVKAGDYFEDVTGLPEERTYVYNYTETIEVRTTCKKWKKNKPKTDKYCKKWNYEDVEQDAQKTYTVDSDCVYARHGNHAFTEATPGDSVTHEILAEDGSTQTVTDTGWLTPGGAYYDKSRGYWRTYGLWCNDIAPLALTNDPEDLEDYIDDLDDYNGTAGHMGIAWGWYLLSPEWTSIWPADSEPLAYDEPDSAKALIMMTDGSFNSWFDGVGSSEDFGYLEDPDQGSSFEQAADLCDSVKATGIVIYTVAFQAPSSAQTALDNCSSGPEYSFDPQNDQELEQAYKAIATSIADLRITS